MDIGKAITKNPGRLKKNIFKAAKIGNPYSTIFLIRSNITPRERDTMVNADIAKINTGNSFDIIHLSIRGIFLKSKNI